MLKVVFFGKGQIVDFNLFTSDDGGTHGTGINRKAITDLNWPMPTDHGVQF